LGNFSKADMIWVTDVIDAVSDAIPTLAVSDAPGFSNQVALRLAPAKSGTEPGGA
jgi:hypothetical protein